MTDPTPKTGTLKTYTGIAALLVFRDELRHKAAEIMVEPEQELAAAKARYHTALINSKRLHRRADDIQKAITIEMQQTYDEQHAAEEAYQYHQDKDSE